MIFDTHAHYGDHRFDEDRNQLLLGMKDKGIGNIVEVGADKASTRAAVKMAENYDFVYAAVGVHPSDVEELTEADMQWMSSLTEHKKVVAVGEIGLDYYYDEPDREVQKKWFIRQLQVAAQCKMPVIIHSRDAAQDTLEIMNEYCDYSQGGVIHCFSYSPEIAKIYLDKGFYLGIGGVVTFKNSKKLKEVVQMAPLEQLILETDAPYLTPVPNRGKRNDSSQLIYVAEEIARIKGIDVHEVVQITRENAEKMYRL